MWQKLVEVPHRVQGAALESRAMMTRWRIIKFPFLPLSANLVSSLLLLLSLILPLCSSEGGRLREISRYVKNVAVRINALDVTGF